MNRATIYRYSNDPTLTHGDNELAILANAGDLAEQAGAGVALDCLDALLAAKGGTQGERITIVQNAIVSLSTTGNPARAVGGFACVVEYVIKRGLENLQ